MSQNKTLNEIRSRPFGETTRKVTDQPLVKVRACKYNGDVHRNWQASVREQHANLIVLDAVFENEVNHPMLGCIPRGTHSTEYYFTDKWFNIFRFALPDGTLRNYYCNIAAPAALNGNCLSFIDLDIDILVAADFSLQVLDEDEFAINAARWSYDNATRTAVGQAQHEVISLINARAFPFSLDAPNLSHVTSRT